MRPSKSRRKRGFTLIEVLLVLVILVILASLAVVNIMSARRTANLSAAKTQIGALNDALETYAVVIGQYPSQATGLSALRVRPNDIEDPSKWYPFLDKDISADPWGKPYQYRFPGVHNMDRFDVYTTTPEGQEIGNWTEQK